jgi:hypothetical protein
VKQTEATAVPSWPAIDWTRPWYASVLAAAQAINAAPDWRAALDAQATAQSLCTARGLPLRFVPQAALPDGMAYEAFIDATGSVPTRDNLHDFFNALVWLSFPRIKAQLNALQAAQIALAGIGKSRGAARDAATIFDENAALIVVRTGAPAAGVVAALRAHQWQDAFVARRAAFGREVEVWLFGHALMEKLVAPYKAITAHSWVLAADDAFFALPRADKRAWIDGAVAAALAGRSLSTADFTPLPVLGVPGWWPAQDAAFYQDAAVFRPKRASSAE